MSLTAVPKMSDLERQIQIAVDAKERAENCKRAIGAVCLKWNCIIRAVVAFEGTEMGPRPNGDFTVIPNKGVLVGPEAERDARSRANNCSIEIDRVLVEHKCGVIPWLTWKVIPLTGTEPLPQGRPQ